MRISKAVIVAALAAASLLLVAAFELSCILTERWTTGAAVRRAPCARTTDSRNPLTGPGIFPYGSLLPSSAVWERPEHGRTGPAPRTIPDSLESDFTFNRTIPVSAFFLDERHLDSTAKTPLWTIEQIEEYRLRVRRRERLLTYDMKDLYQALDAHSGSLRGRRGLVIGTEKPWAEAMLLEYGAAHVSTVEYAATVSDHPHLRVYTPRNFTTSFRRKEIPQFDFGFSFSSLEHDGLGRYGDILNPQGDVLTMRKLLDVIKPNGILIIGLPCCYDALVWNAHRIYGPLRIPMIFNGWEVTDLFPREALSLWKKPPRKGKPGTHHGVFVAVNRRECFLSRDDLL